MVEVFKTLISDKDQVDKLIRIVESRWQHVQVNVDLDDCDKILRVESRDESIDPEEVVAFLALYDFQIELIE